MIENFLTTEQVAKILQVHPFTILKFIKHGKLRGVKLGRVYRMKESDVHEFLESRMTGENKAHKVNQAPSYQSVDHLESDGSDSGTFSDDSEEPSAHRHAYDPHPSSATHSHYTLKKDENGEEGPPHYVI